MTTNHHHRTREVRATTNGTTNEITLAMSVRTQPIQIVTKQEQNRSPPTNNQTDRMSKAISDTNHVGPHNRTHTPPAQYPFDQYYHARDRSPRRWVPHVRPDRSLSRTGHSPSHRRKDHSSHERYHRRSNGHSRSRSRSRSHGRSYSNSHRHYSHSPSSTPIKGSPASPFESPSISIKGSNSSSSTINSSTTNMVTDFKLMTYDTMRGRLLTNIGEMGRFEATEPKMNLNHEELFYRVVWYKPPMSSGMDMTQSENDECYLRSIIVPILRRGPVHDSIQWIAIERNYLLPDSPFNVVIQFSPSSVFQCGPGRLLSYLNDSGPTSKAFTFNQYQLTVCKAHYTKAQDFCLFYFEITPKKQSNMGCQHRNRTGQNCPRSHQLDEVQSFIRQLLRDAGASRPPTACTSATLTSSSIGTPEIRLKTKADDLRLMSYDTMTGRLIVSNNQFERLEPTLNHDHQELLFRVVCSQPPLPSNGIDLTDPANDENYLRNCMLPYLTTLMKLGEIRWLAIDRTFLLPGSHFNVLIQLHPISMDDSFPPIFLISRLNAAGHKSDAFNWFQFHYFSIYDQRFRQTFCSYYFEITPSREKKRGCSANPCTHSHQLDQFTEAIQLLLNQKGAPIVGPDTDMATSESTHLGQPDIELETFEQFSGALKLLPGCTSIDQTIYDPHFIIATRDSESIIHRLVWTDTIDPPSLDELTTDEARADDLCQVLGQLTVDNMIYFDEIDWITRIYSPEGQPTKFILVQCQLSTSVSLPLSRWNRDVRSSSNRPLKLFPEWWLQQRLSMGRNPDLRQQRMCHRRWTFFRLADGRLVNNCDGHKKRTQHCRFSHDPQLMIEFVQRERAIATTGHQMQLPTMSAIDSSLQQSMELIESPPTQLAMRAQEIPSNKSPNSTTVQTEPQTSPLNSSSTSTLSASAAFMNDLHPQSDSFDSNRSVPVLPSPRAQHPFFSSYPLGSVLIDASLLPTGRLICQPPLIPFTERVNREFNVLIPANGLIQPSIRDEWVRTGQLSDASRIEDVQFCLTKLKELQLLTSDMDLLMMCRHIELSGDGLVSSRLLCHFRSHASLIKLQTRIQAAHDGRPLGP